MMHKNGFTLVEVLLTLVIIAIIFLIVKPFSIEIIEKKQEEKFLEMLQADILFTQNLAMHTGKYATIYFFDGEYRILVERSPYRTREIPNEWIREDYGMRPIGFTSSRKIRKPGTMRIRMTHSLVKVVFPFGKGRNYIEEI